MMVVFGRFGAGSRVGRGRSTAKGLRNTIQLHQNLQLQATSVGSLLFVRYVVVEEDLEDNC